MMKVHSKKGFTLVEVLIVVAIIAILAAIAIPIYSSQMEKSKQAVDKANLEAIKSMAVTDWLVTGSNAAATYYGICDGEKGQMTVLAKNTEENNVPADAAGAGEYKGGAGFPWQADANEGKIITITIDEKGKVLTADWQ